MLHLSSIFGISFLDMKPLLKDFSTLSTSERVRLEESYMCICIGPKALATLETLPVSSGELI